jgi:hypothetical protein
MKKDKGKKPMKGEMKEDDMPMKGKMKGKGKKGK